jgi:hypothetical protein
VVWENGNEICSYCLALRAGMMNQRVCSEV